MSSKTETINQNFVNMFEARQAELSHAEGSLRDELLSAHEARGSHVFIPRGTVLVEGNSNTLTPESFVENSHDVAQLREKQHYLTGYSEGSATRLRGGRYMSGLDREFHKRQEKEPNGNNLTFLYDEKAKVDEDELHIPAAILVHGELSDEQVAHLRETLPPSVPILDAKTNELLDDVGQEERESRRRHRQAEMDLGFISLLQTLQEGRYVQADLSAYMKGGRSRSFRASNSGWQEEFLHTPIYYDMNNTAGTRQAADYEQSSWGEDSSSQTYDMPKTEPYETPPEEKANEEPADIPESEEVRAYREAEEAKAKQEEELRNYAENAANSLRERDQKTREAYKLVDDAAQEKFGKPVDELNDTEKKSLRRQAARDYHPDYAAQKDTVDRDKFEAFDQVLK